jgi:hypothetical protein
MIFVHFSSYNNNELNLFCFKLNPTRYIKTENRAQHKLSAKLDGATRNESLISQNEWP